MVGILETATHDMFQIRDKSKQLIFEAPVKNLFLLINSLLSHPSHFTEVLSQLLRERTKPIFNLHL